MEQLAAMVEDLPALREIAAISLVEAVDIVAVGSSDMSRARGVGYCNCAPAPEVRILESMQAQVAAARG